jgi:hypothetical protein
MPESLLRRDVCLRFQATQLGEALCPNGETIWLKSFPVLCNAILLKAYVT